MEDNPSHNITNIIQSLDIIESTLQGGGDTIPAELLGNDMCDCKTILHN